MHLLYVVIVNVARDCMLNRLLSVSLEKGEPRSFELTVTNFCSVVRSWTCLYRLPRSYCPDAYQFYVGFPVLFHASYSWVGQSGNEKSFAVTDFNVDGENKPCIKFDKYFNC